MTVSRALRQLMLMPLAVPLVLSNTAVAQQRADDPNVTVRDRPRPEYDPVGARLGTFRVLPEATITGTYSDNVNFDEDDEESDLITTFRPSVALESDWSRHELGVEAGSEVAFHVEEDDNDYIDLFLNGDGRLDISRATILRGNAGIARSHENQDEGNNNEVEEFTAGDAGVAISHQLNRVTLTLSGDVERIVFDDDDEEDENRTDYNTLLRATYDVSPDLDLFVEGRYNILDYDELQDVTNDDQDSSGYEGRVGAGLNLTAVLFGEGFVGYRVQEFEEDNDDEQGISFGLDVNWNITPLTSIGFTGQRDFQPSDEAGANSNFQTTLGVAVSHELLRNMIVDGSVEYENDDFRGDNREDDIYRLGLGGTYWINRNASVNAGYEYSERDSNEAGQDFQANEISLGLTLRF